MRNPLSPETNRSETAPLGRMRLGVVHVHVEAFRGGVDLVVELVRPGSDDLLQIVVTELAVVKRVVARVNRSLSGSAKSIGS